MSFIVSPNTPALQARLKWPKLVYHTAGEERLRYFGGGIKLVFKTTLLLFSTECGLVAIHVSFSMINALVHLFWEGFSAFWEILEQHET